MSNINGKREFLDTSDNLNLKKSKKSTLLQEKIRTRGDRYDRDEVESILNLWASDHFQQMFKNYRAVSQNHDSVWDLMAKAHNQNLRYNRSGSELKNKVNNLKKSQYKTCKLLDDPTQWEFYNLMHSVVEKQNEDVQSNYESEFSNPLVTTEFNPGIDGGLKLEFDNTQDNSRECTLLKKCDFLLEKLRVFESIQGPILCQAAVQLIFSKLSKLYDDYDNLQNEIMNSNEWDESLFRCLVTRDKEFKTLYLQIVSLYSSMSCSEKL